MKVTTRKHVAAFRPYTLEVLVDDPDTHRLLDLLFGSNATVSTALDKKLARTGEEDLRLLMHANLQRIMDQFFDAVQEAGDTP